MRGSSSAWQCIWISWQYWGSTRTHSPVTQKPWEADITAVSVIPPVLFCPTLISSTALLLFTFLHISPFPWAWLSILLTDIERDNFVDHYCVITVISSNYLSTPTSCWKDAQGAPCSAASATLAGRLLPAQTHGQAAAHAHLWYCRLSPFCPFVSFQQFSEIVLFNRSRNFASCRAPDMYFCSE